MAEHALKCPQCNAPLPASRFASSVLCPFCGTTVLLDEQAVPAARFRQAFAAWNAPENHGFTSWASFGGSGGSGGSHWATGELVARGEVSDVYAARRARWPTERALLKVLRDRRDAPAFEHEWEVLTTLQEGAAADAGSFANRLPQPILHGDVTTGTSAGARAMVLRWADGFRHTFEDVERAYPGGIEPRASIWIWRRILETLAFLHQSGFVHGAVLPQHLLVEDGEHGVRLVGYRAADRPGARLRDVCARCERFYPKALLARRELQPAADLAMSARCLAALLGGDPATGAVPGAVPAPLADEIGRVSSLASGDAASESWALRERLGELAREVFGPPTFCPLRMP